MSALHIDVLTIFPDYFPQALTQSVIGKALAQQKVSVSIHNLRDFGIGKHRATDDRPYGGGAGMVMLVEPIERALQHLSYQKGTAQERILLTSAKGQLYTQQLARRWTELHRICIICGHYEGVDERVATYLVDDEIRIGDYVLTGGEPAALVLIDSLARLQHEVLGNEASLENESHDQPGVLGYPQYSRPANYHGWEVPKVLQEGNHAAIDTWRRNQQMSSITEPPSTADSVKP